MQISNIKNFEFYTLVFDVEGNEIILTLHDERGVEVDRFRMVYRPPVDNLLLTAIDNLLNRNRLHKFALKAVQLGQGVDKNSSLYRMVQSFAAAITAAQTRP